MWHGKASDSDLQKGERIVSEGWKASDKVQRKRRLHSIKNFLREASRRG